MLCFCRFFFPKMHLVEWFHLLVPFNHREGNHFWFGAVFGWMETLLINRQFGVIELTSSLSLWNSYSAHSGIEASEFFITLTHTNAQHNVETRTNPVEKIRICPCCRLPVVGVNEHSSADISFSQIKSPNHKLYTHVSPAKACWRFTTFPIEHHGVTLGLYLMGGKSHF